VQVHSMKASRLEWDIEHLAIFVETSDTGQVLFEVNISFMVVSSENLYNFCAGALS
jgi:hypothetical protein